jgi:hypothetical protein
VIAPVTVFGGTGRAGGELDWVTAFAALSHDE